MITNILSMVLMFIGTLVQCSCENINTCLFKAVTEIFMYMYQLFYLANT